MRNTNNCMAGSVHASVNEKDTNNSANRPFDSWKTYAHNQSWAIVMQLHTTNIWQRSWHAAHCNTLQHTATHCNTLQLTANTQYQYLAVLMAFSTAAPYRLPAYSNKWLNFNMSVAVLASLSLTFAVEGRGVLSFVSLCCIELQCVAVCCSVLQCVAVNWKVLQCIIVYCSLLQ